MQMATGCLFPMEFPQLSLHLFILSLPSFSSDPSQKPGSYLSLAKAFASGLCLLSAWPLTASKASGKAGQGRKRAASCFEGSGPACF